MKEAVSDLGVTLCFDKEDPEPRLAIHIITPDLFKPIPGKINILFTMYESTTIPETWKGPIQKADVLMVPCRHNRDLFAQYYKGPIEVCQEGINPELFKFHQRKMPEPNEPFRFLWVGAPNPRKGYEVVQRTWTAWLQRNRMPRNCQVYFKTSGVKEIEVKYYKAFKPKNGPADFFDAHGLPPNVPELPGIIYDSRDLPITELVKLYNSAHAFVLPSLGEGWGLTLCEAMATGAPCIWTHWSGPKDFADETIGFPLTKLKMIPVDTVKMMPNEAIWVSRDNMRLGKQDGWHKEPECHTFAMLADGMQLIQRMEQVYHGYLRALERGRKASERMHARFKWSDAGKTFVKICEKYEGGMN